MRPDVIIVGAGAAGLAAANVLSRAGRTVMVLEARDRLGGRIQTLHDPAFGVPVELGAEFIHGRPEATWNLLREGNLLALDLPFDNFQRRGKRLVRIDDFSAELAKVMHGLARLKGPDISVADYLARRRSHVSVHALRMARSFVEGFDAADTERISARSIAEELQGVGDVGEDLQFRLLHGYGTLIEYLHGTLNRRTTDIKLNTAVMEIKWKRGHAQVVCTSTSTASQPSRGAVWKAPRVIVTLPLGTLQLPPDTPGSVRFSPDLPEMRRAVAKLGSGPVVKVIMKFRSRFWEEPAIAHAAGADKFLKDASFMHDPDGAFPTFWTHRPLRVPVLTAWAGGPKALALSSLSHKQLATAAIESLARLLRMSRARVAPLLQRAHSHNWPADPWSRGAYSYVLVGGSAARRQLAQPVQGTLFFAGEAVDTSGQASTVAGALASGEHAAGLVLRSL